MLSLKEVAHRNAALIKAMKENAKEEKKGDLNEVWTLTFGDVTESHVGMAKNGTLSEQGYSKEFLMEKKKYFESIGCTCEMVDLSALLDAKEQALPGDTNAYVLIARGGLRKIISYDDLYSDLNKTKPLVNTKSIYERQGKE